VLEGAFLIERALRAGLALQHLYCVPAREAWARALPATGLEPEILPEAEIARLAGYAFHRGALALASRPGERALGELLRPGSERCTILVLPELGDPENLGAAFRNASALGCSALLLGPSGPDPLCRRVLRVSMGSSLSLPWARLGGPEELELVSAAGYLPAACVLDQGAADLRSWARPERLALLLGNEAFGLSEPWLEGCRVRLTLPMSGGTDSLNVATAAAIFLHTLSYGSGAPPDAPRGRAQI
jgi:tRNA G18 (ribose-2'-O)-methylase SpoU